MHDTTRQFSDLWPIYLAVVVATCVIIYLIVGVALLRFRRREGRSPSKRHDALPAELAYIGLLTVIAATLYTLTFRTEDRIDPVSAHPAVRIQAIAYQWQWTFVYPGRRAQRGSASHFATLVVPSGETVQFALRSRDVLHGFFIPAERFKRYAFPDRWTRFDLRFDHPGRMLGECSQFCGWNHAEMRFNVRVVTPDAYRRWLAAGTGA